jgi:hypothetical protein
MASMESEAECGKCGSKVKDRGIQCDVCTKWHHVVCSDLPDNLFKAVNKYDKGGIKWLCKNCDKKVGSLLSSFIGTMEKQEKLEKEVEMLKMEFEKMSLEMRKNGKEMKDRQETLEAEVEGVKKEVVEVAKDNKTKYSEIVKHGLTVEQVNADRGGYSGVENIQAQDREFQVRLTEAMERDKRKNNVVIMGINEDLSEDETRDFIDDMLAKLMDNEKTKIEVKGRIGKNRDKCRPVRVEIEDHIYRRNVMKKASTLKTNAKFEKVYIAPDLTRKQQEEDKILRDNLKKFRNEGIEGVKINKGCVVRMDGNNRVVLFGAPSTTQ